jgi:DNA-binding MarR family transcriptional regulator
MAGFYADADPDAQRSWAIVDALRRYGTDAARLGHAFAALHQLQPADLQALVAVMSAEGAGRPLTPGLLRQHLGLSSGGTSYVIDRLEKAGHVRRARDDPQDNRVVHLRYTDSGMATGMAFFGPLGARTQAVIDRFSPDEQDIVRRFLDDAVASVREHLTELEQQTGPPPSATAPPTRPRDRRRREAPRPAPHAEPP